MRVLLVDDEAIVRGAIGATLRSIGCTVVGCANADEAMISARTSQPLDLLVTDIDLGAGKDGFALADDARREWPELPILFVTGVWNGGAPGQYGSRSALLRKPFRLAELTSAIGRIIHAEKDTEDGPQPN
jgi:CheY-like chemotaxis protein